MDLLSNLKYAKGSIKKRKRVGRGQGSGHGKTSCRGENGQHSRSGAKFPVWFEGGQMPLQRRVPKFGFTNVFKVSYVPVSIQRLQSLITDKKIEGDTINPELLYSVGVLSKKNVKVKILGQGELTSKINVEAHAFSKSAIEKIEAVGGKVNIIK